MYSSISFSNPDLAKNDPDNPNYYPLVALHEDGKKNILPKPPSDWRVSDSEYEAVTIMYPWVQGRTGMPQNGTKSVASTLTSVAVPKEMVVWCGQVRC